MQWLKHRWRFAAGLHANPISAVVAVIWALIGIWALVAFFCPPKLAEAIAPYHFIPGWRWYWWVIGALIVALFWVFEGAYHHARRLHDKLDGTPKLVCKGVSWHDNPLVRNVLDMGMSPAGVHPIIVGTPTFYHLNIANEPTGISDRKVADKVAARVQIFHEDGTTPAADERLHRWEDSPGPAEVGKQADRELPLDIPPSGVEYNLDIAMKYDKDDDFYTPNNETVLRGSTDWREVEFRFPPGTYIADVHLRGANVATDLRCRIINRGKGEKLEITTLSGD
jgi:hypothetical protein